MEEKKRKNKIHKNDEKIEFDDEIRQMLLLSLKEPYEQYEKELNENPKTKEIKPSEDLFKNIVEKLKDQGVWDQEPEENMNAAYPMLSKEDREFLELGKKVKRINKRTIFLKRVAIAACIGICIFGVSMTSEANRQYVVGLWNEIVGNSQLRIKINVEDETDDKIDTDTRDLLEYEAMQQVKEKLGIQPLEMLYKPEGMKFSNIRIEKDDRKAILFYEYKDTLFTITMQKKESRSKYVQEFDGVVIDEASIHSIKDKIKIWKINDMEETYATQIEGEKAFYIIRGSIEKEKFEKIVKDIIIFN